MCVLISDISCVRTWIYMIIGMYGYVHGMCVYICICKYVCIYMYMCMYACAQVIVYVCVYI